jgi:hypothetical protein
VLRVKSLLSYAHRLACTRFIAGATIRVGADACNRGATLAKRIISELEVGLLVRGARTKRDRIPIEVRPACLRGRCAMCRCRRSSADLCSPCAAMPATMARYASRKGGGRLTARAVLGIVNRVAAKAGRRNTLGSSTNPLELSGRACS